MGDELVQADASIWRWWPCFVSGLLWPFAGRALRPWLPSYLAAGAAFGLMWMVAGLLFLQWPPSPAWRFANWIKGALLGAVVCAVIAYLLPYS